jgi:hypothetical protein
VAVVAFGQRRPLYPAGRSPPARDGL